MELAEFLAARLNEDEAAARKWPDDQRAWRYDDILSEHATAEAPKGVETVAVVDVIGAKPDEFWTRIHILDGDADDAAHIARHDPARVLRQVLAGRNILARYDGELPASLGLGLGYQLQRSQEQMGLFYAICQLAAVYADHPDYDQAWKP